MGLLIELFSHTDAHGGDYAIGVANIFCPTGEGGGVDPTCSVDEHKRTGSHKDFVGLLEDRLQLFVAEPILVDEEDRGKIKAAIVKDVAAKMDGVTTEQLRAFREDWCVQPWPESTENQLKMRVAQKLVDQWAKTSGDSDKLSNLVQDVAEQEFRLKAAYLSPKRDAERKAGLELFGKELPLEHREVISSFLRATYQNTQDTLKAADITHMEVTRGYSGKDEPGVRDVRLQPLSSFTTDRRVAEEFAAGSISKPSQIYAADSATRIVSARIPRERIFSTALTGPGCVTESEVVVLGGEYRMHVGKP